MKHQSVRAPELGEPGGSIVWSQVFSVFRAGQASGSIVKPESDLTSALFAERSGTKLVPLEIAEMPRSRESSVLTLAFLIFALFCMLIVVSMSWILLEIFVVCYCEFDVPCVLFL